MSRGIVKIPALALVVFLTGVVALGGAAAWIWHSKSANSVSTAEANDIPVAARIDRLDGDVAVQNVNQDPNAQPTATSPDQGQPAASSTADWTAATVNTPVSTGSRIYAKGTSKAAVAFTGRTYARLNPETSIDVLALQERRTQLALRSGSCVFDVGALAPGELFEVGTPDGAVDFEQPGLYQVGIDDGGNTVCSVLSGDAQVVGLDGTGDIARGQCLTLSGTTADDAYVSTLDPDVCGQIVDDYYSYRYQGHYDGRYRDYARYVDDPTYYDPYRTSASYQYISDESEIAGLDDLNDSGQWVDVPNYGKCWHPTVAADWAPYRDGYWQSDVTLGLSWVSNERWGWAPYHYGRWSSYNGGWYWIPGEAVRQPVYAPALVAFVAGGDQVGWVPLGPGDPYVPRYYDRDFRPRYVGTTTVVNNYVNYTNLVNYRIPGAVTLVGVSQFGRVFTPRNVEVADAGFVARWRPVGDPYAIATFRQEAPRLRDERPRIVVPETFQQQILSRRVVASQVPNGPAGAFNRANNFNVQAVSQQAEKKKWKLNNSGQTVAVARPNGLPMAPVRNQGAAGPNGQPNGQVVAGNSAESQARQARIAALAPQAAQGNKAAKQELLQLQDQQRIEDKTARKAAAQQQAQQAVQQQQQQAAQRQQEKATRQQQAQQQAQQAEQLKQQQKAARQQQAQQQAQAAAQVEQQKQQQKAARQQQAQQQAQAAARVEQQKQQQKAARQQQAQQQAQAAAQAEQQKQQQKAARQQQSQQQAQAAAQAQQQKQQEKAARQQQAAEQAAQAQQQKQQAKAARQQQAQPQKQQQQQQPEKNKNKNKNKNNE